MYFCILDTETTNDIDCPFVYDFGFSIIDENGKVYASYSYVNADIFCDEKLMSTAYFAEKIPQYWHDIEEMKQILHTNGIEFESLRGELKTVLLDAFIMSSSEKRVTQWEKALKLAPIGTLHDRRVAILQYFAINLKLNSEVIKSLVSSIYNGARAHVSFDDSEIKILIVPLPEYASEELDLSLLMKQLEVRTGVKFSE